MEPAVENISMEPAVENIILCYFQTRFYGQFCDFFVAWDISTKYRSVVAQELTTTEFLWMCWFVTNIDTNTGNEPSQCTNLLPQFQQPAKTMCLYISLCPMPLLYSIYFTLSNYLYVSAILKRSRHPSINNKWLRTQKARERNVDNSAKNLHPSEVDYWLPRFMGVLGIVYLFSWEAWLELSSWTHLKGSK